MDQGLENTLTHQKLLIPAVRCTSNRETLNHIRGHTFIYFESNTRIVIVMNLEEVCSLLIFQNDINTAFSQLNY